MWQDTFFFIAIIVALLLFIFLNSFFFFRRHKKLTQQLATLENTLQQFELAQQNTIQHHEQLIQTRKDEAKELRAGLLSLSKRVQDIEQLAVQMVEKQETLEHTDSEARLYSRAVKMVELGAGLQEVIRECEIPLAEAELILSLHKPKR